MTLTTMSNKERFFAATVVTVLWVFLTLLFVTREPSGIMVAVFAATNFLYFFVIRRRLEQQ